MKFVDEATLKVQAGNGGRGCVSFRREKFVPFGGPDGGDGGLGGSVWLRAGEGINTLADFRIARTFKAKSGEGGSGNGCTGRSGEDLHIPVPVGTVPTTWRVVSSIRLSVASPELSTITLLAWAAEENRPAAATSAALAVNAAERPGKRNLRMKAHFGEQRAL